MTATQIPEQPNDRLVVGLLGITGISVFYSDMTFPGGALTPACAEVDLSDVKYNDVEPTDDQQFAVRTWVAAKLGIPVNKVDIN